MSAPPVFDHAVAALTEQVRAAIARQSGLLIRGGGSKDFYGMARGGEPLSTLGLNGVLSYEPSELVVTVGAGTPLVELEALLNEQGQCLPFEPPHFARSQPTKATVGGMVACGLSGPARASSGSVRDYVLGLQMLNGQAEQLTFGGQVMKNVAGYDVSRLMVGAMGTLGVITQVSLKVLPIAPAEATLVFEIAQEPALELLHRWGAQPLPLNASCWVRDDTSTPARDLLFVRLRGAVAAVEAASQKMLADADGQRMDTAQAAADWTLCRDQALPFFLQQPQPDMALWRLSLPQTAPVLELPWPQLIEWHGALRWLWAPHSAADSLQEAARRVGGSASVFARAPGQPPGDEALWDGMPPAAAAIAQRLKTRFDPQQIFNPPPVLARA